jgi:Septum formation
MSSNATGDVPADATAGTGSEAPAEPAEPAQVAQLTERAPEELADPPASGSAEPQAPELVPDAAAELTEDTDDSDDSDDPDHDDAAPEADGGEPAEPAAEHEPAELAGEPIEMAEPMEFAEPVEEIGPARRGHAVLLTVGFVVAALAIIGGGIAIVGSVTHGFKKPVQVTYTKSAVFSLRTGECVDPHGQSASVVSCNTPHDAEVFATFTLPESKWPGDTAVQAAANSGCATRLTGYINPQLAISLSSTYVYPDSVAWQAGTRTVICEVTATSGQLTGSVRGATATAS